MKGGRYVNIDYIYKNIDIMENNLDNQFDKEFDKIKGLTWYPWVGKNYANTSPKVLILGLSQYAVDEDKEYCEETEQGFMHKEINREFLFENIELLENKSKFYINLYKTYSKDDTPQAKYEFLNNIAFYNFFQTVDQNVSGNNRDKTEYLEAWSIFNQVISLIKPDICIFHGKEAHKHMEFYYNSINIPFQWEDVMNEGEKVKIDGSIPVEALIDNRIKVLFCKHPSTSYSVKKWRDFILEMLPEMKKI